MAQTANYVEFVKVQHVVMAKRKRKKDTEFKMEDIGLTYDQDAMF